MHEEAGICDHFGALHFDGPWQYSNHNELCDHYIFNVANDLVEDRKCKFEDLIKAEPMC